MSKKNVRSMMGGEVVVTIENQEFLSSSSAAAGAISKEEAEVCAEMGSVVEMSFKGFILENRNKPKSEGSERKSSDVEGEGGYSVVSSVPQNLLTDDDVPLPLPFEELCNQRMQVGEGDVIPALDLALSRARVGQILTVRCTAKYAYGPSGRAAVPPSSSSSTSATASTSIVGAASGAAAATGASPVYVIPPHASLQYEIKVLAIQNLHTLALPQPLSLGETGTDTEQEQREVILRNGLFQALLLRKEVGNRWYHYGDFSRAVRSYAKGAEQARTWLDQGGISEVGTDASTSIVTGGVRGRALANSILDGFLSVLNNMAACHMLLGDFPKAKEVCIHILEIDGKNIKALLRAARVSLALHDFNECQACIDRVLLLEPENPLALAERNKLKKAERDYRISSKELAKRMFMNKKGGSSVVAAGDRSDKGGKGGVERGREEASSSPTPSGEPKVKNVAATTGSKRGQDAEGERGNSTAGDSSLLMLLLTAVVVLIAAVYIATREGEGQGWSQGWT